MSETKPTETFNCPNCGGPIEYDGKGERTVKCPFCGKAVDVPESLLPRFEPQWISTTTDRAAISARQRSTRLTGLLAVVLSLALTAVIAFFLIRSNSEDTPDEPSSRTPSSTRSALATATQAPAVALAPTSSPIPPYATQVMTIGGPGITAGKFDNAIRLGVDAKNNLYVAEYAGGRVQVFDPNGQFITQWFAGNPRLKLTGFAVGLKGDVYLADGANIMHFDGMSGKSLGTLAYPGDTGFSELAAAPGGGLVAVWQKHRGDLVVSSSEAREDLVIFDPEGKVTQVITAPISSQTYEAEIQVVPAVDGKGNIYLLSHYSQAVFKFTPQGKFVSRFSSEGATVDRSNLPNAIAIDGQGNVYTAGSRQINSFGPDGRFIRSFEVGEIPARMIFDNTGQLITVVRTAVIKYELGR